MIKRAYIITAASIMAAGTANAQEDLNRSVDVSKDYAPRVERAAKLGIQPQLGDTVTLRPDLEYTVRPRAWTGGFGVTPIRAAQMNAGTYNPQYPLYIKVGGGFPGQTILDLYATSIRPGTGGFGGYVNHRAQLADLKNYYDTKQRAKSTTNSIGAFGKAVFGKLKRWSVAGELGFDYDVWSHYGEFYYLNSENRSPRIDDIRMQHFATPHAAITFGSDFTDLSFLNFRVGGDVYSLTDRRKNKETGGRAFAEAGKQFGMHRLVFGADAENYKMTEKYESGETSYNSNSITSAYADYALVYENITFGMGARFALENPSGNDAPDNKTWFLPQAELKIAMADEFNFYARMTSGISPNSYRNTVAVNPFSIRYGSDPVPARVGYEVRAGFNGTLAGIFSYKVYAGSGIVKNELIPVINVIVWNSVEWRNPSGQTLFIYDHSETSIIPDKKRKSFFVGAELEAKFGSGFTVTAAGRYDKYESDLFDAVNYLPDYTASLGISYNHHDKWQLRAGLEARGEYKFLSYFYEYMAMFGGQPVLDGSRYAPAAVNVTLGADYFLSERLGVFVEGDNLANQKIYPLPFYRGVGINVSAGVKLRF